MKFCGNCGNSVPDDARACPYCGSMLESAPAPAKAGVGGFIEKYKKLLIGVAGAILALVLIIVLINALGGGWKAPIKDVINEMNSDEVDMENEIVNMYGGLGKKELKKIYKIVSSSKNFKDYEDESEDSFKDEAEDLEDEYGKNWKYSYEIDDKDDLDKDDLKDIKDEFKATGKDLIDFADRILDLDNDDLKDLADDMGLKKDELKDLAEAIKDLGKTIKSTDVKKGYEVELEVKIEGKDDDDSFDADIAVVKADGSWVIANTIYSYALYDVLYGIGYSY